MSIPELYGITDGKAVGTFVEHAFLDFLLQNFTFEAGSSASGIDFPSLEVDLKVTSVRQPQSSCPFRSASQKVYGLGYDLLVLVYEKRDDSVARSARLEFRHAVFIERNHTGDYQTTRGLRVLLDQEANLDDIVGFLEDRNLPLDEIGRESLAQEILTRRPEQGYLTVSNALQWRLQYGRVLTLLAAGEVEGLGDLTRLGQHE